MANIHIAGLGSDMDIEGIIEKMVKAKSYQKTMLEEDKEEVEIDISAWAEISNYVNELTTSLDTLRSWETWNTMNAVSSNESAVTATASSGALDDKYIIEVISLATAQTYTSDNVATMTGTPGDDANTDLVAAGVLTHGDVFTIEGELINIDASETLRTLQGKINTTADSMPEGQKVVASIIDNRLVISRKDTGDDHSMALANVTGDAIGGLNLTQSVAGDHAEFNVNGVTVNRQSNTNLTDVIDNISLSLHDETTPSTITLTINRDEETPKNAILDFIEKYNNTVEVVSFFTSIKLGGESTIGASVKELGELYNDSLATGLLRNLRKEATESKYPALNESNAAYTYNNAQGICSSLSDIGVWTSGEGNSLSVTDENRLDYMIEEHFDEVEQLFRGIYDEDEGYINGVATDFYTYANSVSTSLTGDIAMHSQQLTEKVDEYDKRIATWDDYLANYEERLWFEFAAMEEAMQKMKSNISWLAGQISMPSSG